MMETPGLAVAAGLFLLSAVKFLFAPGAAIAAGFSIYQSVLITSLGGICGVLFFYHFGYWAMLKINLMADKVRGEDVSPRKVFTRRNRMIVNVKLNFGLIGLALVTPAILSIPIGAVIAARFYHGNPYTLPLLLISTLLWSFGLSIFSDMVKTSLLGL